MIFDRLGLARLRILLPIFFIFAFESGSAERLEVLDVKLLHDELAVVRIGPHLVPILGPPDNVIQYLPFGGASLSVSDTLDLDFALRFSLTLHPINISNVSARRVIVAVHEDEHVPLRMGEDRRMSSFRYKIDVLQML